MSLNSTPSGERVHIGIFGRRNAGKSSVINAMTAQKLAIVSEVAGTTTDPVYKSMELLPLGPVTIIDTPGLDDEGALGEMRVQKSHQVLNKTDIAILVVDATTGMTDADRTILERITKKGIPLLTVFNKADLLDAPPPDTDSAIYVSATRGDGIQTLKERIAALAPRENAAKRLVGDLVQQKDTVVLVIPIDAAAPKGRLILPQQQVIRDLLESGAIPLCVRETELDGAFAALKTPPRLVITDSQAFSVVSKQTPDEIPLTSFSILFARYKGNLETAVRGAKTLDTLKAGDRVLISEGCTHHRQCEDIGTVKLPNWIQAHTGCALRFSFTSGTEFPDDLRDYALILHCGGCMLNEREMQSRIRCATEQGVPITNYGIAIAHLNGILKRSLSLFPELYALL